MEDFKQDMYKASLHGENGVLVEVPTLKHFHRVQRDAYYKVLDANNPKCDRSRIAADIAITAISHDKRRSTKRILLRFPDVLSDKKFISDEQEIEYKLVPVTVKQDFGNGKVFESVNLTLQWTVMVKNDGTRRAKKAKSDKSKGETVLANMLSGMVLG